MTGWLVVNQFLNKTYKFSELTEWFLRAAAGQDISLTVLGNLETMLLISRKTSYKRPDFVLFWDKDIRLARLLEGMGLRLFNCADAIEACDDKSLTYIRLKNHGIRMPQTLIAPKIYQKIYWEETDFLKEAAELLSFPIIVKEVFGSFGEQVFLAHTEKELASVVNALGCTPFLLQEFIKSSEKRDIRIQMVKDTPVASMYRYSTTGDFRANISHGGKMKPYEPSPAQVELARKACRALSLDFAGVDILFGENEVPILCEVNSNAHFVNIHSVTGVNAAECILNSIKKELSSLRTLIK